MRSVEAPAALMLYFDVCAVVVLLLKGQPVPPSFMDIWRGHPAFDPTVNVLTTWPVLLEGAAQLLPDTKTGSRTISKNSK